jgi:hypothetical protein
MKKSLITYAMVAAVTLGFMSCSQDETAGDGTNANKQTITFVSGDETSTRTSMGGAYTDTSFPFYWEKGDAIWVNAKDKITGSNAGTASYALFTVTAAQLRRQVAELLTVLNSTTRLPT